MKVAVVGGTRFIGLAAVKEALRRGHEATLLHRGVHAKGVNGAQNILVDRTDPKALRSAIASAKPDVVIDTFAMTKADAKILVEVTEAQPLVVLSSQDVYAQFGALNGHPCDRIQELVSEDSELTVPYPFRSIAAHAGGYDYDKKDVESVLGQNVTLNHGDRAVTVLRLPAVYGPNDYKRRFGVIVDELDRQPNSPVFPMRSGASFRHAHADVRDVAHAIVLAAENTRDGYQVYNVAEETTPTMRERADKLAAHIGVSIEWQEQSDPLPDRFGIFERYPNDFVVDTSRIRRDLEFHEITSEEQRLADLIRWLRESRSATT